MKKEKTIPDIHIGSIIKAKAAERGVTEVQLAKMIHCHFSTIHDIYKRKSINTDQLWKISEALQYNFFTEIYGNGLKQVLKNNDDYDVITIVLSADKISLERDNGTMQKTEYRKISEK